MRSILEAVGWIACIVYSTIPAFWLLIHARAEWWRSRRSSPYGIVVPAWLVMWAAMAALTLPWRHIRLYLAPWGWIPALCFFCAGFWIYRRAGAHFTPEQLYGLPEVRAQHPEQRLVTTGIRAKVRHPVYLGHLLEMLAWSLGTGLLVCYALVVFALLSGAVMIRFEDAELERRFGEEYRHYRSSVPAVLPRIF